MKTKQTAIAKRSQQKLYFDHKDMDYYFAWIVSRQIYDGSKVEECFDVASRIIDGDLESWQQEWVKLAQEIEKQGSQALDQGNLKSARELYLRACTYYRSPLFIMNPQNSNFSANWRKMKFCFQKAASLFDPPIESIQVPFHSKLLPGYFWKVDNSKQKRPTLIVIGGLETFAEDGYFMTGLTGTKHGYNVMTVDLPGQGVNPYNEMFLGARMGNSLKAVVDYALTRPEIDPEGLSVYGFSWGGHIVFQGVQDDPRIKALIANPAMPDVFRAALAQQGNHGIGDPISNNVFKQIAWRMGLKINFNPKDICRRIAKACGYFLFGKVKLSKIQCPTLCLAGEGEAQITLDIARECYEQLSNPLNKLVIFTQEEGGEAHCQINNLALPNQVMFDWLARVFSSKIRENVYI